MALCRMPRACLRVPRAGWAAVVAVALIASLAPGCKRPGAAPGAAKNGEGEKAVPVETAKAVRETVRRTIEVTGTIQAEDDVSVASVTTAKIEEFLEQAKQQYTIFLVPHNIQQAARVADYAGFFLQGKLVEYGTGEQIFMNPKDEQTRDYVQGRFG